MTKPLAAAELAALRELDAEATPGPWYTGGPYPSVSVIVCLDGGCGFDSPYGPEPPVYEPVAMLHQSVDFKTPPPEVAMHDASLIAAARNALPRLLDELERLRVENARLRAALGHCEQELAMARRRGELYDE